MHALHYKFVIVVVCLLGVAGLFLGAAPRVHATTFSDVPATHWAHDQIDDVTDKRLLTDYGKLFAPQRPLTRLQFATAMVRAAKREGVPVKNPVNVVDIPPSHPSYRTVQMALRLGFLVLAKDGKFNPEGPVLTWQAEVGVVRWLKLRYPSYNWGLLTTLYPTRWRPNKGWNTRAPSYLPFVVASRQLQLRFNHLAQNDDRELVPTEPLNRAEAANLISRGYAVSGKWYPLYLGDFKTIEFPPLSARQRQIMEVAFKYIGYPYVWGGEYPTENSPYGYQASGGFDCSGFVFYLMKMRFGYPVNERGANDMAARAKPRITRAQLKGCDLIFFGRNGPKSSVAKQEIYHAGLYLGNGWFIHSTSSSRSSSSAGVTLNSLDKTPYYKQYFAWGRRVLTPAELKL